MRTEKYVTGALVVGKTVWTMDQSVWLLIVIAFAPICGGAWHSSSEEEDRKPMRGGRPAGRERASGGERVAVHNHVKRHMLPSPASDNEPLPIKRPATPMRVREPRKRVKGKPSGHLTPLKEDDIDNDEVVSVAIDPPPLRPIFEKSNWKSRTSKLNVLDQNQNTPAVPAPVVSQGAITMVKNILVQMGRELLTHQVSEDFGFGQYVGQAMRNMTSDLKLKFQHDVLDLIIRYQKLSRGEVVPTKEEQKNLIALLKEAKDTAKLQPIKNLNETDENWGDFTNLAKLVG